MSSTRVGFPGTINSGDPVSSTNNNHLPGGLIGRDQATANVSSITSATGICSISSVTVGANRGIFVMGTGSLTTNKDSQVTSGNDANAPSPNGPGVGNVPQAQITLTQDGTAIKQDYIQIVTQGEEQLFTVFAYVQPDAGSHSYALDVGTPGTISGQTVSLHASGTNPAWLLVFDCGPAFS